ncbi:ABC transporter ATP-binding protein [Algoriphagus litoralis]|uniref:ABC transporter ATP-binding protein n=1 Tax=Algoriphagus litoralis TaxID=2202829 RepID=UPI000DB96817|nr:ABC transporter ATP-binding protein [Algoriphagus litoralis]
MISLNSVSKQFNNHLALDNFSLEIPEGEIFALLGPNGAGKTTTINLLLGFLSTDSGTVSVAGIEPFKNPAEARKIIGYIPENVNLYPQLTGLENLKYFTQLASSTYSDEDLRHFLSTCGLQKSAMDRPLGTYSKGMRQKVGIAIAYAKKAKILLMDEPASGLDPLASKELSDLIRKLAKMGTTVLMASHDLFRVKETADRIGIIHQGKLLKSLKAAEVTANDLEEIYLGTIV